MLRDHSRNEYQLTEKRLQKAKYYVLGYKMGTEAHAKGVRMKECPLDRLDPLRKGWKKGWRNANRIEKDKMEQNIFFVRPQPIHGNQTPARTDFQKELLKRYRNI